MNSDQPRATTPLLTIVAGIAVLAALLAGTQTATITNSLIAQIAASAAAYIVTTAAIARLVSTDPANTLLGGAHLIVAVLSCSLILLGLFIASVGAAAEQPIAAAAQHPPYGTEAARAAAAAAMSATTTA